MTELYLTVVFSASSQLISIKFGTSCLIVFFTSQHQNQCPGRVLTLLFELLVPGAHKIKVGLKRAKLPFKG